MTTADTPSAPGWRGPVQTVRAAYAAVQHALDRPLTSYYLLLGSAALLLTMGMIMVLSASSVYSFRFYDGNSYHVVMRQLTWVVLGVPCAWIASRLPHRWIRRLAWPGYFVSLALLLMTAFMGVERNGNQNWLALGPVVIQPSEIAKLALILWAAHVYAHKDRRLRSLHETMFPVVPGMLVATALVVFGNDLGTALVLFAILLGMLWVVGAPARFFGLCLSIMGVAAFALARTSSERMDRITSFTDPFRDFHGTGWQPAHGLYALSSGGWFGEGIGASRQKWGDLPEAHTDFIFAVLGEELGLLGTLLMITLFLTIAYAAVRVAQRSTDAFTRYMTLRHRRLAARPDDDQRRHGPGAAAGHRHPAAARVLRRLGPRAVAGGARPAHRLRPARAPGRRRAGGPPPQPVGRAVGGSRLVPAPRQDPHRLIFGTMRVLLAGGGTAGHTSPLLATADALRRLDPDVEITCLGTPRGLENRVVPAAGYRLELIPPVPLPRRPSGDLLRVPGRLREAVLATYDVLDRVRPDVVVGYGGYVSMPAYLAARRRKLPLVVHEQNALPGLANKAGARIADRVAVSFPATPLPKAEYVGLPIRTLISGPRPRRAAGRGTGVLRPRPGPPDAAGHRRLAGRPAAQPVGRGRGDQPDASRRPGAPRRRAHR